MKNNILKTILEWIKMISGFILLLIIIVFWLTALLLTTLINVITWCELKLTKIMKKCFGEIQPN